MFLIPEADIGNGSIPITGRMTLPITGLYKLADPTVVGLPESVRVCRPKPAPSDWVLYVSADGSTQGLPSPASRGVADSDPLKFRLRRQPSQDCARVRPRAGPDPSRENPAAFGRQGAGVYLSAGRPARRRRSGSLPSDGS